jgi:hypothetical protein
MDGPAKAPPAKAKQPAKKSMLPVVLILAVLLSAGGITTALLIKRRAAKAVATSTGSGSGGAPAVQKPPPTVGKPDQENQPPQVKSFTAKAMRVPAGASTELVATIVDPENDTFYAWWTASCGAVSPRSTMPGHAYFIAPTTPGPCAISVEVQDHEMKRSRRLQYTIEVTGGGA